MILPSLFKSKRFWIAVTDLVFMVVVAFVPELAEHAEVIIPSAVVVIGVVIGGYTMQDVASAMQGQNKYNG